MGNNGEIEQPKRRAFLAAYADCGVVSHAAVLAKVDRGSHYVWMHLEGEQGDKYREAFAQAKREACDVLETEARRRAVEGVETPVFQGGENVGSVQKFSDTLLIFLMKGAMPDKYADRQKVDHRGAVEQNVRIIIDGNWYGNRIHNQAAPCLAPPGDGLVEQSPPQDSRRRPSLGQDGNGDDGNGDGTRPA